MCKYQFFPRFYWAESYCKRPTNYVGFKEIFQSETQDPVWSFTWHGSLGRFGK